MSLFPIAHGEKCLNLSLKMELHLLLMGGWVVLLAGDGCGGAGEKGDGAVRRVQRAGGPSPAANPTGAAAAAQSLGGSHLQLLKPPLSSLYSISLIKALPSFSQQILECSPWAGRGRLQLGFCSLTTSQLLSRDGSRSSAGARIQEPHCSARATQVAASLM